MIRTANVSACERYRYMLRRRWGDAFTFLMWVMLNPSTADDQVDDPTIVRVMDFSQRFGFDGAAVCNKFAIRSTDPSLLARVSPADAQGPENSVFLTYVASRASKIVVAWGNPGGCAIPPELQARELWCLGRNKSGSPRHPLYLPKVTPLERYA